MPTLKNYSIKVLKTFEGNEGIGFNAYLLRSGKKVCYVIDAAQGGEYEYRWEDSEAPRVPVTYQGIRGAKNTFKGTPEEKILNDLLLTLPPEKSEYGDMYVGVDGFIGGLIDEAEIVSQYRRWCRTKVCFRLTSDEEGSYRTIKGKYTTRIKEHILTKYGDALDVILNDRYGRLIA